MPAIGLLTTGGDCPGLNAVIRGVVRRATDVHHEEVVGILNGWEGFMAGDVCPLGREEVRGILQQGGTILGTSRMDPYVHGNGYESLRPTIERNGVDTVIVAGGDGSLKTALQLQEEGMRVIGVPKTIDNDIAGTDVTFGFDTAVHVATEAIDRITTTAESHDRLMVVEVMGRTKGWIALYSGLAAGADAILVPELPYDLGDVADVVRSRAARGRSFSIVVVAEGVAPPPGVALDERKDAFGFTRVGGVAYAIAPVLEELTGFESRVTVLGYVQRGGTPTAFDRVLATRLGVAATDLAVEGASGVMVGLQGTKIVPVPLEEACAEVKGIPLELYDVAQTFFG